MTITALFLAAAALLAQGEPAATDKSILDARTFSVQRTPDGDAVEESNLVPYRPGISCFEWVMLFEPRDDARDFSEVLELPGASSDWSSDEADAPAVEVSADGSSGTVAHRLEAGETELGSSWCLAPGDPLGTYHVTVREGGRVIRRFDFRIVVDEDAPDTI